MARKKQTNKKSNKAKSKSTAPTGNESQETITENISPTRRYIHKLLDAKIEIIIQVLREKHILIATPCYGGQIGEPTLEV